MTRGMLEHEFVGLGSVLTVDGSENATVRSEDGELVLTWPGAGEIRFNLTYAGVRLFTGLLLERRESLLASATPVPDAGLLRRIRRFIADNNGTDSAGCYDAGVEELLNEIDEALDGRAE